jgi:WD40 repeat protein
LHRLRSLLSALKPTRLGVLFAVLVGLGVGFWQWIQPPRPRVVIAACCYPYVFSPDGQTLATVVLENKSGFLIPSTLTLWNAQTGHKTLDLFKGRWPLGVDQNVVFSPDGRKIACRIHDHKICVWDTASGMELATYDDSGNFNNFHMVYSSEGKLLTVREGYVLWDVAQNKALKNLLQEGEFAHLNGKNALLVSDKIWDKGSDMLKVWNVRTGTFARIHETWNKAIVENAGRMCSWGQPELASNPRFLIYKISRGPFVATEPMSFSDVLYDLEKCRNYEFPGAASDSEVDVAIAFDGRTAAWGVRPSWGKIRTMMPGPNSLWTWIADLLGLEGKAPDTYVSLMELPSEKEIIVLKNCSFPVFSHDGKTLAVTGTGDTLQLWDLPIRKPVGKILGLAGLAAVATLLGLNGIGWLRRRRMRLNANVVPAPTE